MYFHKSAMLKEVLAANEITDGTPTDCAKQPNNDDKQQTMPCLYSRKLCSNVGIDVTQVFSLVTNSPVNWICHKLL
jgi:hypothetical protein